MEKDLFPLAAYGLGVCKDQVKVLGLFDKEREESEVKHSQCENKNEAESNFSEQGQGRQSSHCWECVIPLHQ